MGKEVGSGRILVWDLLVTQAHITGSYQCKRANFTLDDSGSSALAAADVSSEDVSTF